MVELKKICLSKPEGFMSPTTLPPETVDEKKQWGKKKKNNNHPEAEMPALSTWSVNSSS